MPWTLVAQLFWGFGKVGLLGFGGGPGSLSLIQTVSVSDYHWITNEQFGELLAVGNALPGPIATKMAAAIGWRVAGGLGVAAAVLGVVLPSLILILAAYGVLLRYKDNPYVAGLIRGVKPVVLVLLVGLVLDFAPTLPRSGRLLLVSAGMFVLAFLAIRVARLNAVYVILAGMAAGAFFLRG